MSTKTKTTTVVEDNHEPHVETEVVVEVDLSSEQFRNIARLDEQLKEGIVNPIVLAKAVGIRPQMVYNYIRAGKIQAVKHNNTQKLVIERAEAERFASKYLTRKARQAAKAHADLAEQAQSA